MATKAPLQSKKTTAASRPSSKAGGTPPAASRSSRRIPAPNHPDEAGTAPPQAAVKEGAPAVSIEPLKKQELLQAVSDRTDLPKARIRPVIEAVLEVLGQAVADDRALQLPPLGKLKPLRSKMRDGARISHVKIRQNKQSDD